MNKKKVIFWGVIITSAIFVFHLLHGLFGDHREFAGGHRVHGHGPIGMGQAVGFGQQGGFGGHHQFTNVSHHGGSFPWLALLIGLTVLVLLVRWFRKKAKTSSVNQFIDTTFVSPQSPVITQNARILDQWERNVTKMKENE